MKVIPFISGWLRKLKLLGTAEHMRFIIQKWKYRKINNAFIKNNPEVRFPPPFYVYETYRLNYSDYYNDGWLTASEIISQVKEIIDLNKNGTRILDWGCGPGRIVRHLPQLLPSAEIYGTDYNSRYIKWGQENLPQIRFSRNTILPPLGFENSFFDLIIGISIFTHLSQINHSLWIDELYRVIRPGGILFITTQGLAYRTKLLDGEVERFDRNELVIRENTNEGNRLYSAFQPPEFIKDLIKDKFEIVVFEPARTDAAAPAQDIWILKKA